MIADGMITESTKQIAELALDSLLPFPANLSKMRS